MNREELNKILSSPTSLFLSHTTEGNIVNLVYPATKEAELRQAAIALGRLFRGDGQYIDINTDQDGKLYNLVISAPGLSTPLFYPAISCDKNDYNELLLRKQQDDKVSLGLYIHLKEVQRTGAEIAKIKADPKFDEHTSVTGLEPYFVAVEITVAGKLIVKSDDQLREQATFVD